MQVIRYRTHYEVKDYIIGSNMKFERYLSKWVMYRKRGGFSGAGYYEPVGFVYDDKNRILRFPAGVSYWTVEKYLMEKVIFDTDHDPFDNIPIRSFGEPKDDIQRMMIRFLLGEEEYADNKNHSMLCCNAQTGQGKTFASIVMMAYYKCKTAIIVHTKELALSWITELTKYTDIDEKRILVLDADTMVKIMDGKIDPDKYYVFIVLHQSINSFVKRYEEMTWEVVTDLFLKLRVGLKVIDETNMMFHNIILLDTHTNIFKNIYLTATMKRSDEEENKVFQRCFYSVPKFDPVKLGKNVGKKHIRMIVIEYNSHPSIGEKMMCKRRGMFDVKKYADYLVNADGMFFEILNDVVYKFAVKNEFRTLILCAKISSCDIIADWLKEVYPDKKIGVFNSSISKDEKERVKKECDIIVSIIKSLGVGVNLPGLRAVINTEAFRFDGLGDQSSGRLRKWTEDTESWYIELVNIGFENIRSQYHQRMKLYQTLFKSINIIKV